MDTKRIKLRLVELDRKLVEVARRTGIPYDRTVRIVHGYRRPYRDELRRIAEALDLTVDDLRATNVLSDEDGPQAA
jgi:predicted transcriptional regulator